MPEAPKDTFPVLAIPVPKGRKGITFHELGLALAEFGKKENNEALRVRRDILGTDGYRKLKESTRPYLEKIRMFTPPSFSFMEGVARGLNVAIEEVGGLYTQELYNPESGPNDHCTTMVNHNRQGLLVVHNEEWCEPGQLLYILQATLDEGIYTTALASLSYLPEPPGGAVTRNSHGTIMTVNSLHNHTNHLGVPKTIVTFELSRSTSLSDAKTTICRMPLSSAMDYIISSHGQTINIETAGGNFAIQQVNPNRPFVHANFITAQKLQNHDPLPSPNSEARFKFVSENSWQNMSRRSAVRTMSNTSHPEFPVFSTDTKATVVVEESKRGISVRRNHLPNNRFHFYSLPH